MASKRCARHVFVTGFPGVGKTSLVQKVVDQVQTSSSVHVQGFITEEVREDGDRIGFDIVALNGQRGVLSRKSSISQKQGPKVGQYVVDVENFEQIALPSLHQLKSSEPCIVVVDEIGRMELFSETFIQLVRRLLQSPNITMFGTIPITKRRPHNLIEEIRKSQNVQIFTLSKANRDEMVSEVFSAVQTCSQSPS